MVLVLWAPNKGPQTEVLTRTEREILYGGARGGGKTDAGLAWLLRWIDNPKLRVLVLRETYDDLVDWIDRAMQLYEHFGATKSGIPVQIIFPSGATIRTGYLKGQSYDKYKGHEYQKMIIEELTQIPGEDNYEKILGSLRSTVDGLKPQVFCTTNPDGVGRLRVKRRFVDKITPGERYTDPKGGTRVFIPARISDNPVLVEKDPSYIQYLEGIQDDQLRKAWLEGDWEAYDIRGGIYTSQIKQARVETRVCKVPIEPNLPVNTARDLGMSDATAIIFFQTHGKEIRIIDSYYNEGENIQFYANILGEKGYKYGKHYLPHDAGIRSLQTGKTMVEYLREYGITAEVLPRTGDIWADINKAREIFAMCWFDSERCQTLIEHLEIYRKERDDKHQTFREKPYHGPESHFADAYRYLAVASYSFARSSTPKAHANSSLSSML